MSTTHTDTITAEALRAQAFANIVTLPRGTVPSTEVIEDPTTLSVGDSVWAHSRGNWRLVVVTEIGRKNAKAIYTTQGSIDETERIAASALARDPETERRAAEASARENYLYTVEAAGPADNAHWSDRIASFPTLYGGEDGAERIAKDQAEQAERLSEMGDIDTYVARRGLAAYDRAVEHKRYYAETPLHERVTYTSVTVKPGAAKKAGEYQEDENR